MQAKTNRFANFADADDVPAQVQAAKPKAQEKPKKQVIRVQKNNANAPTEGDEFEAVQSRAQAPARGGDNRRGGDRRGGRGGERGRGGRGGRPRTAVVEGEEGAAVERAERGGERQRYQGKAREDAHPMDRKDGTGRGRRGDRKGGAGKGNWGDNKRPDGAEGEEPRERRERKPREPREPREKREDKPEEEEKKPEPVVEEEEVGFTLDDYLVQKKTDGLKKNEVRKHEKIDDKNVKDNGAKDVSLLASTPGFALKGKDVHKRERGEGAELLGFGNVNYDDDFERRGARGQDRPQQRPQQRGGRKGGKLVVNDNEFPTL